jgi:hypothetical protein
MPDVTFHNVTITINAQTPAEAYETLCNALSNLNCEWTSDTFSTDNDDDRRDTEELFP